MPVRSPKQCKEATVRSATACHDGLLVISSCHLAPLGCTGPRHVLLGWSRGDTSTNALEHGRRVVASPRQAPCRGRCLVMPESLSLAGSCRDARASFLKCLGWPSRQAPLAGALSPWLEYFVLEWLHRNHGGSWRSPGKPCRGVPPNQYKPRVLCPD